MSPWLTDRLTRLAAACAHWRARHMGPLHTLFVQPDQVRAWGPDAAAPPIDYPTVQAWAFENRGARARLVLSAHLTRELLVSDPALPLHDRATLATWARHQWGRYHGALAQSWPVAAWAAGATQRGACALHGLDLPALHAQVREAGAALVSAQPWWAVALAVATRETPTLAQQAHAVLLLHEGRLVTWLVLEQGCVVGITQRWLAHAHEEALQALQAQLLSALPADARHQVYGYGLDAAASLAPQRSWLLAA